MLILFPEARDQIKKDLNGMNKKEVCIFVGKTVPAAKVEQLKTILQAIGWQYAGCETRIGDAVDFQFSYTCNKVRKKKAK